MSELLQAEAIAVDCVHVHVLCPFCGKVHRHGSMRNSSLKDYGSRVPHCSWPDPSPDGNYEIITTPATIRKEYGSITNRDLKAWDWKQKRLRESILQERKAKAEARYAEALVSVLEEFAAANNPIPMYAACRVAGVPMKFARLWLLLRGVGYGRGRWYLSKLVMENRPDPYHARLARIFPVV